MIAAPVGDDAWLDHVVRRLSGQALKPEPDLPDALTGREPPILVPVPRQARDGVIRCYTEPAYVWHSFTPVILPGHDDHKPDKTRALIERALRQSDIDQACDFEWSAFSRFSKSYPAHKYDQRKRPQGYFRPSYLNSLTAVHLTLRFKEDLYVPGPLAIGAGRHCGFGLMAHFHPAKEGD
jgi:CRISPR-associated protein Csb2